MDFKEIPPPSDNAWDFLKKSSLENVIAHANLLHHVRIIFPSSRWGTATVSIKEGQVFFDFTKFLGNPSPLITHRLQITNASDGPTVKYRVSLGKVAGQIADPGMEDPGDDPPFTKTMSSPSDGWYVIYCKLPMSYSGEGNWTPAAGSIFTGTVSAALPANSDDFFYAEIGQLRCEGGKIVEIPVAQAAKNDIVIGRSGNETDYRDTFAQVLSS